MYDLILSDPIEICTAFTAAILGIAYPILLEKVNTIDEKYNSVNISKLFLKEWSNKIIKIVLIFNVITYLFFILNIPPPDIFSHKNILQDSATILVLISTILLLYILFVWIYKLSIYRGSPIDLLNYIIDKYRYNLKTMEGDGDLLKAINDLSIYAIKTQSSHLQETVVSFYSEEFLRIKNQSEDKEINYYDDLYFFNFNATKEILKTNNNALLALEYRVISCIWLLGEDLSSLNVSDRTYIWIWNNLQLTYSNETYIRYYWQNAYQSYTLIDIYPEFDVNLNIINKDALEKHNIQKNKFWVFHIAYCGLLLYKKQYVTINYIINYSRSIPIRNEFFDISIENIIKEMVRFSNDYSFDGKPLDLKFPFPDIDNLGQIHLIRNNIVEFIEIILIRRLKMLNIDSNNINSQFDLPREINELTQWKNTLIRFRSKLKNEKYTEYIELFSLKFKQNILEYILNELISLLSIKIQAYDISSDFINNYEDTLLNPIKNMLEKTFTELDSFTNKEIVEINENEYNSYYVNGVGRLVNKNIFRNENQLIEFSRYYSNHISDNIYRIPILKTIFLAKNKSYLFKREQLVLAITGLTKNMKLNTFKVIVFSSNRSIYEELFKELDFSLMVFNLHDKILHDTLFIVKNEDLPIIINNNVNSELIETQKLKKLISDKKMFYSLLDLNIQENLFLKKEFFDIDDDLNSMMYLSIDFNLKVNWKKINSITQINIYSQYTEQGSINTLKDIIPI